MTLDEGTPGIGAATLPAPGETLRQGRERAALSQEDIASKLKLSPRQIAAIETGDWSALPERTFTRGFMRNYARLVGIDPDSLGLDHAPSQPNAATQLKPTPDAIGEIAREADYNGVSAARWLVPTLLIAALVGGVLYFQGGQWFGWDTSKILPTAVVPSLKSAMASKAELPVGKTQTATDAAAASSGAVIAPAAADPTAAPTGTFGSPAPAVAATPAVTAAVAPDNAVIAMPPGASPIVQSAPTAPVTTPLFVAGDKRISLNFKGKSWTEVRSKGEVIFSETALPGVREFSGTPPLSFTVGNASNVTVTIDGKLFDIADLTRNDVARFRVE